MNVMFVSPEAVPFAKTGGLADVAGALPIALSKLGLRVCLLMPLYGMIRQSNIPLTRVFTDLEVHFNFNPLKFDVYSAEIDGVTFYFVERDEFFDRRQLYGTPKGDYFDNLERYVFLAKTVKPVCQALNLKPDILHCHDWQSALVPVYLQEKWHNEEVFTETACDFYRFITWPIRVCFPKRSIICWTLDLSLFWMDGLEFYDKINFLKGGIVWSDAVTTVSRQYSEEIQTPEFGCGLEGVLSDRADILTGIVNGIDYNIWDPATDTLIAAPYSAADPAGKGKE